MLLVIYWRENRKDSDFTPKLYCYYTNDNASKALTWVSLMSCLLQFFTHIAFKNSKHLHKKTSTTSLSLGQTWYLEFRANNFCSLNHTFCLSKNKISWLSRVTQPMGYVGGTCLVWQMVLEASRMVTCLIFCVRWTQESRATKIFMFVKLDAQVYTEHDAEKRAVKHLKAKGQNDLRHQTDKRHRRICKLKIPFN